MNLPRRQWILNLGALGLGTFLLKGISFGKDRKIAQATSGGVSLQPRKSLCGWVDGKNPEIIDQDLTAAELNFHSEHIKTAIELSKQGEAHCNHPFGALLVLPLENGKSKVLLKSENRVYTDGDSSQHAEMRLITEANRAQHITEAMLSKAILYTSAEPCAMCSGAIFWAGVRKVVYAAPHESFGSARFRVPSREVFKYARRVPGDKAKDHTVEVIGPVLAELSIPVVKTYFDEKAVSEKQRCSISHKI